MELGMKNTELGGLGLELPHPSSSLTSTSPLLLDPEQAPGTWTGVGVLQQNLMPKAPSLWAHCSDEENEAGEEKAEARMFSLPEAQLGLISSAHSEILIT